MSAFVSLTVQQLHCCICAGIYVAGIAISNVSSKMLVAVVCLVWYLIRSSHTSCALRIRTTDTASLSVAIHSNFCGGFQDNRFQLFLLFMLLLLLLLLF